MIIIEATIIIGMVVGVYGLKTIGKKFNYKVSKKKLKKLLVLAFDIMDTDDIKSSIKSLSDFDSKHSTNKLDKYLLEIIKEFRDNEDKRTLNESNVLNLPNEFDFDSIFDNDEEEKEKEQKEQKEEEQKEQKEQEQNDIKEKLNETQELLDELNKRRKEVINRKNEIRGRQLAKSNQFNNKRKQRSGKMG